MKDLAAVIIDTYPNKGLAASAIHMALRMPNIKKIYTFCDQPFYKNSTFIKIPPIKSNNEYGAVIFDLLSEHIKEEHFFIIQWDGFPLFPDNWDEDFLNYDYIGAPIDNWVGNGGFSLRSTKLLKVCKRLSIGTDQKNPEDQPEDQIICVENRALLESNGIKFAPLHIARKFSHQAGVLGHEILGFHGPENLPLFISEENLIPVANEIIERTSQPTTMLKFLDNCIKLNFYNLFRVMVIEYTTKPNLLRAINYDLEINPNSGLLDLIKSLN